MLSCLHFYYCEFPYTRIYRGYFFAGTFFKIIFHIAALLLLSYCPHISISLILSSWSTAMLPVLFRLHIKAYHGIARLSHLLERGFLWTGFLPMWNCLRLAKRTGLRGWTFIFQTNSVNSRPWRNSAARIPSARSTTLGASSAATVTALNSSIISSVTWLEQLAVTMVIWLCPNVHNFIYKYLYK